MRASSHRTAGFTLVELLIVLMLIGIFTGVMLAEMRGTFEDALLRSSARDLISGLGLANSRAITLNQPHVFQFDRAKNAFAIQAQNQAVSGGEPNDAEVRTIDERVAVEIRDPGAVPSPEPEVAPPREEPPKRDVICFYADGTADRREIVLRDVNNAELVLQINPVTGRVRIVEETAIP